MFAVLDIAPHPIAVKTNICPPDSVAGFGPSIIWTRKIQFQAIYNINIVY